ncbi:hypothetical protein FOMPIDRAFT_1123480 [Fomitopsis schrenkii]|uniref:Oxidase ustYa n=1 Tax=Fomitopsis schrenkii TaxID=2126942 RepID=S8E9R0_FOMSC|nr:hypothetical protein FOMPIDRAFT_1123480 [Fomitopsis schrenkii]
MKVRRSEYPANPRLTIAAPIASSAFAVTDIDDYPQLPVGPLDYVTMTFHESVHFALSNRSDSAINAEWSSLASHPDGFGRTRLGPDHNLYVLTFYHQLHCLWKYQQSWVNRSDPIASPHHVLHCLNYLRQTFLCEASDILETGDFMKRDFEVDRVGDTVVCQDWGRVYEYLDDAYAEWTSWRAQWN